MVQMIPVITNGSNDRTVLKAHVRCLGKKKDVKCTLYLFFICRSINLTILNNVWREEKVELLESSNFFVKM